VFTQVSSVPTSDKFYMHCSFRPSMIDLITLITLSKLKVKVKLSHYRPG